METQTINNNTNQQTTLPNQSNEGATGKSVCTPASKAVSDTNAFANIFNQLDELVPLANRYKVKAGRTESDPPPALYPVAVLIYLERALSLQNDGSHQRDLLWLSRQDTDAGIDVEYYQGRLLNYDRQFDRLEAFYQNELASTDPTVRANAQRNINAIGRLRIIYSSYKPAEAGKYPESAVWHLICRVASLAFYRDSKKDQLLKNRTTRGERVTLKRGSLAYKVRMVQADIVEYRSKQAHKPLSWAKIAEILPRTHKKLFAGETITANYLRKIAQDICPDLR